jgi:hypothetical protein
MTRAHAKLLGPCFKTGRTDDQLLHRGWGFESSTRTELTAGTCRMRPPPTASSAPNRARNHSPCRPGQTALPLFGYQTPKGWPQPSSCRCPDRLSALHLQMHHRHPSSQTVVPIWRATARRQRPMAEYRPDTPALSVSTSSVSRPF